MIGSKLETSVSQKYGQIFGGIMLFRILLLYQFWYSRAMHLNIFTDGGARGNPGPAGIGVVVKKEGNTLLHSFGKTIGVATNNTAEYTAVIEALIWIKNNSPLPSLRLREGADMVYNFHLDSTLVVNQLNGLYKVKEAHLRDLLLKVRELESVVGGNVSYAYIPREKNWEADRLVNEALDNV